MKRLLITLITLSWLGASGSVLADRGSGDALTERVLPAVPDSFDLAHGYSHRRHYDRDDHRKHERRYQDRHPGKHNGWSRHHRSGKHGYREGYRHGYKKGFHHGFRHDNRGEGHLNDRDPRHHGNHRNHTSFGVVFGPHGFVKFSQSH